MSDVPTPGSGSLPSSDDRPDRAGRSVLRLIGRPVTPRALGYAMGPAALVVILALRSLGGVAQTPVWSWIVVFAAIPATSIVADVAYRNRPTGTRLQVRLACHAAAVTLVIYLSGWGPVLVAAFAFVALENLAHDGSRTWRSTTAWSLAGIAIGQSAIWWNVAPTFLPRFEASVLATMGSFLLVFINRMAGAAFEKKEDAERSMRASEERFRSLVQNSSDTTLVVGPDGRVIFASPATRALLGLTPEQVIGCVATDLLHSDDRERVRVQFEMRLRDAAITDPVEFRLRHTDGSWRTAEAVISDLRDRPAIGGYVANIRDISERKEAEALLAHQALHDPLTGLANRTLILDRAEQMLVRARRSHQPIAALFIDIDNFKEVNDTFGHAAGDELLKALAERFTAIARASDTVGRIGGDEFVLLTEDMTFAAGPELIAERLQEMLQEPFHIAGPHGIPLSVTTSIGIASGHRTTAEDLLRDADTALYRAKADGKDCWALFEPAMHSAVLDRIEMKMDLALTLERDELFLLYQPLIDLQSKTMYGVEALLRWRHPTRGIVGPDAFIPLLEETGQIVEVGRWVLNQACAQAAQWRHLGNELTMSVNISMRQLESRHLIDDVRTALARHQLPPTSLCLEITETALMHDAEATIARLHQLKQLGVRLAIDDFGTGYSSLSYLRQFPVDAVKIDSSFVSALSSSTESGTLVHSMIQLSRALQLETIAEGIENQAELDRLQNEGCERGQGFLFSPPVNPATITSSLAQTTRDRSQPQGSLSYASSARNTSN